MADRALQEIRKKQRELARLVGKKGFSFLDETIYRKSCELDFLIVEYMRKNRQLQINFEDLKVL
ncbi:MAG: hypothetical protein PWQ91_1078 [Eubacteriales bacterium]|nr:hypothetical protein [Eubacteriales bacterium]MDN5364017.1 hypothetical protein [Eubacteriales bacterium]